MKYSIFIKLQFGNLKSAVQGVHGENAVGILNSIEKELSVLPGFMGVDIQGDDASVMVDLGTERFGEAKNEIEDAKRDANKIFSSYGVKM